MQLTRMTLKCGSVPFAARRSRRRPRGWPLAAAWAGLFLLLGVASCAFLPGASGDGYAAAQVRTWQDIDGDGQSDPDEPPLPWVTIQMQYERSITDASGQGTVGVLKPGCARRCWKGELVSVQVPPGYRATTPTGLALTGEAGSYGFGFQPEPGAQALSFPGEPDWFQAFSNRGLDLKSFHYGADEKRLTVSFDTSGSADPEALYRDVFEVISTLKRIGGIVLNVVEVSSLPAGKVAICEMSVLEEWTGKLAAEEIVARYCK